MSLKGYGKPLTPKSVQEAHRTVQYAPTAAKTHGR